MSNVHFLVNTEIDISRQSALCTGCIVPTLPWVASSGRSVSSGQGRTTASEKNTGKAGRPSLLVHRFSLCAPTNWTPERGPYVITPLTLACEQAPGEPERSPRPALIASFSDFFSSRSSARIARRIFLPSSPGACSQATLTRTQSCGTCRHDSYSSRSAMLPYHFVYIKTLYQVTPEAYDFLVTMNT